MAWTPAIAAWTLAGAETPDEQLALAAAAGFRGVEFEIAENAALTYTTDDAALAELARRASDKGLEIVGIVSRDFLHTNFANPDPAARQTAIDRTLRMLDAAVALQTESVLVIPAVVGGADDPTPQTTYADALHLALDALLDLRREAEARDVTIGIENVWNRLFLSPLEAADFVDRVGSPNVGWYFDIGNVLPFGYPQDWIRTLAGRLWRVHVKDYDLRTPGRAGFCPLGAGSVDWPDVRAALIEVGYDGPLTHECPLPTDGPIEACRRLRALLIDAPAAAESD